MMSRNVQELLILAAAIAVYAGLVWLVEANVLTSWKASPQAEFAREHARDAMIAGEFDVTTPIGEVVPDATD